MKKAINQMIMLIVTSLLLFCVVFAWYATNKEAIVTGGVGVTAESGGISKIHVTRYQSTKSSNSNDCTWSESSKATQLVCKYDSLTNYKRIVYVIDFETTQESVTLSIRNTAGTRDNDLTEKRQSVTVDGETVNLAYNNYLSNVCNFYLIDNSGTYTMSSSNLLGYNSSSKEYTISYSGASDSEIHTISDVATLDNLSPNTTYKFYIAFDYCLDKMNRLYSDNLGTDLETIVYKEDIEFVLK